MTTTYYPSNLQWFGLAKEATPGTAESIPTIWVPVDTPKWSPKLTMHTDQAMRGFMGDDYQQVAGMRYDEITYKTYVYMDSIFPHLLALLGHADVVTGTADPATHKTALNNGTGTDNAQPPTYTGFYFDAAGKCWQVPGMVMAELKLDTKVDELDTVDVTWHGLPATAIAAPTNTPTTSKPMPAWNSVISIGGSAVSAYSEVSLDYKRNTKPVNTINDSQSPLGIYGGGVSITGTLTAVYQGSTDSNLVDFLANTQPSLTVKWSPVGDATHNLTLQHSVVAYDSADPQGSGDWMEIQSNIKALMNATDALDSKLSPAQVVFLTPTIAPF
jgi:hypothetical protein